ncbi:MAG: hypothetical protein KGI02_10150 [Thaumarchaeota archaeon]|nr:hypothetical protein [Nitrososphaerota archaeon]MDE1877707.1 hypothetical protein [Nitrososphaerota archaeon]
MNLIIPFNKQEIIDENRKEIEERLAKNPSAAEAFCISEERLDEVLRMVENIGNELEFHDKLVTKAAYFLGGRCGHNHSVEEIKARVFL